MILIDTSYMYKINETNIGASEITVTTPFKDVAVLHNSKELMAFIQQQKEKIHNLDFNKENNLANVKAVRELSNSLKTVSTQIEGTLAKNEALRSVKTLKEEGGTKESSPLVQNTLSDMFAAVQKYRSAQTEALIKQNVKESVHEYQFCLMSEAMKIIKDVEQVDSLSEIYSLYSFPPGVEAIAVDAEYEKGEAELRAGLNAFIHFAIGSRAIDILVPKDKFPLQHTVLKEFYNDETHPMDLQRFLRTEDRSKDVTTVLKNLAIAMNKEQFKKHRVFTGGFEKDFNPFIRAIIQSRAPSGTTRSLLDIQTIPPQISRLRDVQKVYYADRMQIADERVKANFTFSTIEEQRGIYLYKAEEEPEIMQKNRKTKLFEDEANGVVYLRVPDADNRVVRMSIEGYKDLKTIQKQNVDDLLEVKYRLDNLFKDQPTKKVTGRTKSVQGILDKTGRLCNQTQSNTEIVKKYADIRDIIDINGMRITCSDSSELAEVIETLRENGFEFLELDNKYNTIRKTGDYKVIPTTVRDSKSGCVFELQLTTVSSLSISDLNHNVNYKKEAIGLNLNDQHREWVSMLSKFSAIVETLNVMGYPVALTTEMSQESLDQLSSNVEKFLNEIKY